MAKALTRIPTFRSKPPIQEKKPTKEITPLDLNRKVRIADKEGLLRFIGPVHFSPGVWCGIELAAASGKNDGAVQGKRYFTCPKDHGLMVPVLKVSLSEPPEEDAASGPYSILFLDPKDGTYRKEPLDGTQVLTGQNQLTFNVSEELEKTFKREEPLNGTTVLREPEERCTFDVTTGNEANQTIVLAAERNPEERLTFNVNETKTILSDSTFAQSDKCDDGIKRRKLKNESFLNCTVDKPSTLPQLRSIQNLTHVDYNSPPTCHNPFSHSTPLRGDLEDSLMRRFHQLTPTLDDDGSKRDSLDFEESLGILTPEQMVDGMSFMSVVNSRTPSSECIGETPEQSFNMVQRPDLTLNKDLLIDSLNKTKTKTSEALEVPSPHGDITDFSLGILDENLLNNLTLKTDTTMNMELPLDKTLTRGDQTPSPEELPLDPTPVIQSDPKTESEPKSKASSFITSITSITSLDTGYQGDGEMSRPASRGPDTSPLTRRPLPRPPPRRPDPMTDSDFYTESDADNHEDNPLKGDRRAQVIDGTLYGVDPQATADLYANNRENMDSSGIFTDIESNTRSEDNNIVLVLDVSPSDTSTKTISGNSQNNIHQEDLDATITNEDPPLPPIIKENPKKRNAPSPIASSPSSVRSPRHTKEENAPKKFKMPNREVASKVKAMLVSPVGDKKSSPKKPAGRWDAVMNKIGKGEQKTNLKDVKSKVYTSVVRGNEVKKSEARVVSSQKSPNAKTRRVRVRAVNSSTGKKNESVHSSFSDLSASATPKSGSSGLSKKREVVQVTQVLTPSKLSPRTTPQNDSKKSPQLQRTPLSGKPKKQAVVKDSSGRGSAKGGRSSPAVRPPITTRTPPKPAPKVAEALAVLVQHLVFNVEAYQVPTLRRDVQKLRKEAEDIRAAYQHLEEVLQGEQRKRSEEVDEERLKWTNEIGELIAKHNSELEQMVLQASELKKRLHEENESTKQQISKQNEETLLQQLANLQEIHKERVAILTEENDAIREQIDDKHKLLQEAKHESLKLKKDYEAKEKKLKEQLNTSMSDNHKLSHELSKTREQFDEKFRHLYEEIARLKEQNEILLGFGDNKGIQEVQSLRVVLELKQNEVGELRRALAAATKENEALTGAEEKSMTLSARCEDLQHQLQRKSEYEQNLIAENKRLHDSFKEELNHKNRLLQNNEELKWKLRQNKEVVEKVLEQAAEETSFNRSLLSASFNERHSPFNKSSLERTLSFREQNLRRLNEVSPPTSPKVKGVVEKSDGVSYVLDLDESAEIKASRIVRRSFRTSTPPKTTPTKSPANKRARMKNPLSLSASASAILSSDRVEYACSKSLPNRVACDLWATSTPIKKDIDLDLEIYDEDLKLPALPSEMGKNNLPALPSPKHLAGEAMISESNSEDESTSSSSVQL